MERRSTLNANKDVLTVLDSHTKIQCHSKGRFMKKHHTSICDEKQDNPTQSSSYQIKENKNSNTSQSPTNTISKNTTHMGVRRMVSTKTWDDLKPPTTPPTTTSKTSTATCKLSNKLQKIIKRE